MSASSPSASLVTARTACFAVTSLAVCCSTAARPASKAAARFASSIATTRESSGRGDIRPRRGIVAAPGEPALRLAKRARRPAREGPRAPGRSPATRRARRRSWRSAGTAAQADSRTRHRAGSRPAAKRAATSSTSCLLPCATVAEPLATSISRCWLSSSCSTLESIRSQRALMPCSSMCTASSCTASSVTPLIVPPRCSASKSALKRSRVSFTASNATGPPLQRQRGAARQPLREHLHLGRRRRGRRRLRRGPDVEGHDERREHEERHEQDAEDVELPRDRQMADQRHLPGVLAARRRRAHLLQQRDRRERIVALDGGCGPRLRRGRIDLRRDGRSGVARQRFPQIHCKRHGASR